MILVVTTPIVGDVLVKQYTNMVSGRAISDVNMFKNFDANLSNTSGDHASQHEGEIGGTSTTAASEACARAQAMGANAIVGMKIDYFTADANNGVLAVIAAGAAVVL